MNESTILFPNLGITLPSVGRSISIFGFEIAYYGIVIALAMLLGIGLITKVAQKTGQDQDVYVDLSLVTIVCSVIGARIYYVAFSWDDYKNDLLQIFHIRGGGLAIYGGVLAGILTVAVFARVKKQSFWKLTDVAVTGLALGQAIGRWGNFFNREAFGGYTDNLLAMALPKAAVRAGEITSQMLAHSKVIDGVEFIQVHPTFLYESLWNIGLLLLLLFVTAKKKFDGQVFLTYLAGYGVGRFFIEGLRTDQLLIPGMQIPVSQALSFVLVLVAVTLVPILRRRTNVI